MALQQRCSGGCRSFFAFLPGNTLAIAEGFWYTEQKDCHMGDVFVMMKKYKAVFFEHNYTTYKLGEKVTQNVEAGNNDAKLIFYKNYKNLYPLNDDILDNMIKTSEFPKELLEKLSESFPAEDKELFFERCEQMHQLRLDIAQKQSIKETT